MLVYGDPAFNASAADLLGALRRAIGSATAAPDSLEAVRSALILSGQVEQALADAAEGRPDAAAARRAWRGVERLTDELSRLFVGALDGRELERADLSGVHAELDRVGPGLNDWRGPLRVKVPEGFAFYCLYPEQHAHAARAWALDHGPPGRACVVGLRSIGTTLSAVVTAALRARGWEAHRLTIRPRGHPFARSAELPPGAVAGARFGLVVDEGPGLSGSSIGAAARALMAAGLAPERLAILPGHGGDPGPRADDATRALWSSLPRYARPADGPVFGGVSLRDLLTSRTREVLHAGACVRPLGPGEWRGLVWDRPAEWPAAAIPLERPKFLASAADGRRLIWSYAGLSHISGGDTGIGAALRRLERLADLGWSPRPVAAAHGWLALPWIDGGRPGAPEATMIRTLGRYILDARGAVLSPEDAFEHTRRQADLLVANTREALGERHGGAAERLGAEALNAFPREPVARYGDGRMGAHEWVLAPGGPLKLDGAGHAADHTAVGPQPWWWDAAGAEVEWDLNPEQRRDFRAALRAGGGALPSEPVFRLALGAYCAFRLGVLDLAGSAAADPEEHARIGAATARLSGTLARVLGAGLTPPGRSGPFRSRQAPTARSRPDAPRSPTPG